MINTLKNAMKVATLLGALSVASNVQAAQDISLGEPGYGGSGCPAGTASTTLSPDSKSLSILFDDYIVEAGDYAGRRTARKSCNIAVPVHVPQGFSVALINVDYRGFNSLPYGTSSKFSAEYFFAGQAGPKFTKTFRGDMDQDFTLGNTLAATSMVWSRCGADVNLRVNTSMMVRSNRRMADAMAMVDSTDVSAGLVYHLQWKRCGSSYNNDGPHYGGNNDDEMNDDDMDDDNDWDAPRRPQPRRRSHPRRRSSRRSNRWM